MSSTYVPFQPGKWSLQDGFTNLPFQGSGELLGNGVSGLSSGVVDTSQMCWLMSGLPRRIAQRQTHTKSRNGCKSCKTRRVKCNESRPVCGHCAKRGFRCEWPDIRIRESKVSPPRHPSSSSEIIRQPSNDAVFTMQDFRLFYHFIDKGYPHQPLANDSIWTHEIPSIAHDYDFLMHSILALSALDLADGDLKRNELICSAILYRIKAIKSLNQSIANGIQTFEAGNAMLGACYTLLFQSILLEDGLPEFMAFLRGIVLVAFNMGMKQHKFLFHSMFGQQQLQSMEPYLQGSPGISREHLNDAIASLEVLEPMIQRQFEKDFHKLLVQTAYSMYTSSREAYKGIIGIYYAFSRDMTNEDFQIFVNPENEVGQLLQCHFVAIQALFSPVTAKRHFARKGRRSNPTAHWVNGICKNIPLHLQHYVGWPLAVSEKIRAEEFSKKLSKIEDSNRIETVWEEDVKQDAVGSSSISEIDSANDS